VQDVLAVDRQSVLERNLREIPNFRKVSNSIGLSVPERNLREIPSPTAKRVATRGGILPKSAGSVRYALKRNPQYLMSFCRSECAEVQREFPKRLSFLFKKLGNFRKLPWSFSLFLKSNIRVMFGSLWLTELDTPFPYFLFLEASARHQPRLETLKLVSLLSCGGISSSFKAMYFLFVFSHHRHVHHNCPNFFSEVYEELLSAFARERRVTIDICEDIPRSLTKVKDLRDAITTFGLRWVYIATFWARNQHYASFCVKHLMSYFVLKKSPPFAGGVVDMSLF
jgi:hypothetical protein